MRRRILHRTLLWIGIPAMFFTACVDDKYLVNPPATPNQSFIEEFDTLSGAYTRGWRFINHSNPIGPDVWNTNTGLRPPHSGIGYAYSSYFAGNGASTISNWILSPPVTMQNGDKIVFYTASDNDNSDPANVYPDRLQVRLNVEDQGIAVGTEASEVGSFKVNLLDINPNYDVAIPFAYPDNWTRFEVNIYGLSGPTKGRFAFRYFVEDGGNAGANSAGVGIDSVAYVSVKK